MQPRKGPRFLASQHWTPDIILQQPLHSWKKTTSPGSETRPDADMQRPQTGPEPQLPRLRGILFVTDGHIRQTCSLNHLYIHPFIICTSVHPSIQPSIIHPSITSFIQWEVTYLRVQIWTAWSESCLCHLFMWPWAGYLPPCASFSLSVKWDNNTIYFIRWLWGIN